MNIGKTKFMNHEEQFHYKLSAKSGLRNKAS